VAAVDAVVCTTITATIATARSQLTHAVAEKSYQTPSHGNESVTIDGDRPPSGDRFPPGHDFDTI